MFIFSVRANKARMLALACVALAVIMLAVYAVKQKGKAAATDGVINYKAASEAERLAFISQFGWEVEEDPAEVEEVVIPAEWDEIYTSYNQIQKENGLDLEPYRGLRAKRWCYTVLNYPGYENRQDAVALNLLIYDGMVIGGDVCATEQSGFMQGFDYPQSVDMQGKTETTVKPAQTATEESEIGG